MNKKIAGLLVAAAVLVTPVAAFASTTQTFLALDGQTTDTISVGDSATGVLTFNNTGNSTVQSVYVEVPNSHFAGACEDVTDVNSTGTFTVSFPVDTTGATVGTWDVRITTFGVPSNQSGANNDCDNTIGTHTTHTFSNVLTLTASQNVGSNINNTGTAATGGTGAASTTSQLSQLIALLTAMLHPSSGTTPPASTTSAVCTAYDQANAGAQPNIYSSANVRLQGFLLSQGASIPALAAGASFGFYGNQTTAAVGWFNSTNHCN